MRTSRKRCRFVCRPKTDSPKTFTTSSKKRLEQEVVKTEALSDILIEYRNIVLTIFAPIVLFFLYYQDYLVFTHIFGFQKADFIEYFPLPLEFDEHVLTIYIGFSVILFSALIPIFLLVKKRVDRISAIFENHLLHFLFLYFIYSFSYFCCFLFCIKTELFSLKLFIFFYLYFLPIGLTFATWNFLVETEVFKRNDLSDFLSIFLILSFFIVFFFVFFTFHVFLFLYIVVSAFYLYLLFFLTEFHRLKNSEKNDLLLYLLPLIIAIFLLFDPKIRIPEKKSLSPNLFLNPYFLNDVNSSPHPYVLDFSSVKSDDKGLNETLVQRNENSSFYFVLPHHKKLFIVKRKENNTTIYVLARKTDKDTTSNLYTVLTYRVDTH